MNLTITEAEARELAVDRPYQIATDQSDAWPNNWIVDAQQVFGKLYRLPRNWDGSGASSPDGELLNAAWRLVEDLARRECPRPAAISPTPSGGIQIEWEQGPKYFEVEFVPESFKVKCFSSDSERGIEREDEFALNELFDHAFDVARSTCR